MSKRDPRGRPSADRTSLYDEITGKILAELGSRDPERKVEAQVADGLRVQADPRLLGVMLQNLLGNAWKFTSKRSVGKIEVREEEHAGETIFSIRDNGAGFNMEYAKKLFAPFQRLHSEAQFEGTGIGLATVHRVVARHGGRIWAEAQPGHGATFSMSAVSSG